MIQFSYTDMPQGYGYLEYLEVDSEQRKEDTPPPEKRTCRRDALTARIPPEKRICRPDALTARVSPDLPLGVRDIQPETPEPKNTLAETLETWFRTLVPENILSSIQKHHPNSNLPAFAEAANLPDKMRTIVDWYNEVPGILPDKALYSPLISLAQFNNVEAVVQALRCLQKVDTRICFANKRKGQQSFPKENAREISTAQKKACSKLVNMHRVGNWEPGIIIDVIKVITHGNRNDETVQTLLTKINNPKMLIDLLHYFLNERNSPNEELLMKHFSELNFENWSDEQLSTLYRLINDDVNVSTDYRDLALINIAASRNVEHGSSDFKL